MKTHLILVSDGSSTVSLGLAAFFVSVIRKQSEVLSSATVLTPEWAPRRYTDALLNAFNGLELFEYVHPRTQDPYFIKFIIEHHISSLPAGDQVLYLDFDHIVLEGINLNPAQPNRITISSEVKDLENIIASKSICKQLPANHVNTSLIYSDIATLKKLYNAWLAAYSEFSHLISMRFLEEVSFAIAAAELKVHVHPAPLTLQGGCHKPNAKPALFHYGGLSEQSTKMKNVLFRLASEIEQDATQIGLLGERAYSQLATLIG